MPREAISVAWAAAGEPARAVRSNRKQSGDESPHSTWMGDPPVLATGHRLLVGELRIQNSELLLRALRTLRGSLHQIHAPCSDHGGPIQPVRSQSRDGSATFCAGPGMTAAAHNQNVAAASRRRPRPAEPPVARSSHVAAPAPPWQPPPPRRSERQGSRQRSAGVDLGLRRGGEGGYV